MSTWTIHAPAHTNDPYRIESEIAALTKAYDDLSPQYKTYTLVDAMKFVAYRMEEGDTIVTKKPSEQPSVTCPKCRRTSYNPDDIAEGYCGKCHEWTSPPQREEL